MNKKIQSKHTPGPWKQEYEGGSISQSSNIHKIIVYDEGKFDNEEGQANARLIAAAPELLEACKTVLKGTEYMTQDDFNLIKSAIARAEGRAS